MSLASHDCVKPRKTVLRFKLQLPFSGSYFAGLGFNFWAKARQTPKPCQLWVNGAAPFVFVSCLVWYHVKCAHFCLACIKLKWCIYKQQIAQTVYCVELCCLWTAFTHTSCTRGGQYAEDIPRHGPGHTAILPAENGNEDLIYRHHTNTRGVNGKQTPVTILQKEVKGDVAGTADDPQKKPSRTVKWKPEKASNQVVLCVSDCGPSNPNVISSLVFLSDNQNWDFFSCFKLSLMKRGSVHESCYILGETHVWLSWLPGQGGDILLNKTIHWQIDQRKISNLAIFHLTPAKSNWNSNHWSICWTLLPTMKPKVTCFCKCFPQFQRVYIDKVYVHKSLISHVDIQVFHVSGILFQAIFLNILVSVVVKCQLVWKGKTRVGKSVGSTVFYASIVGRITRSSSSGSPTAEICWNSSWLFSRALLLQGATLLVTLSCHPVVCPWQDPSFSPPNYFPHFHYFYAFLDISCHLECSKKFHPKFFFTLFFSSISCGWIKARHNATKHSSLLWEVDVLPFSL